ncbi:MAG: hypothetical protein ACFFDI_23520 [Promethearchaeota archaeon]
MVSIIDTQLRPLHYWMIGGDRELRNSCKEQLQCLGHQMTGFVSVDEAVNALVNQAKVPDIFLIDYHLPRQSGLVLSWLLRDLNLVSKIIFMTTDPSIEDEGDPITPIILQQTLDFRRLIRLSEELVNQKQSCLVFSYENDKQLIEKTINIIKDVVPRRKCLLLVSNKMRHKMLEKMKTSRVDQKHIIIYNVTKYLPAPNYAFKLIALYLNFLEEAMKEKYASVCVIVDFKPLLPFLDRWDLYVNGTTIKTVLNYLKGNNYLICAYPSENYRTIEEKK